MDGLIDNLKKDKTLKKRGYILSKVKGSIPLLLFLIPPSASALNNQVILESARDTVQTIWNKSHDFISYIWKGRQTRFDEDEDISTIAKIVSQPNTPPASDAVAMIFPQAKPESNTPPASDAVAMIFPQAKPESNTPPASDAVAIIFPQAKPESNTCPAADAVAMIFPQTKPEPNTCPASDSVTGFLNDLENLANPQCKPEEKPADADQQKPVEIQKSAKLTARAPGLKKIGEVYASNQGYFLNQSAQLRDASADRLFEPVTSSDQSKVWGKVYGSYGKHTATHHSSRLNQRQNGILLGIESASLNWRFGLLGSYTNANLDINSNWHAHSNIGSYQLGAYAGVLLNNWNLHAGTSYAWHKVDTKRSSIGKTHNTAGYDANAWQIFGGIGHQFILESSPTATFLLEPSINLAYVKMSTKGFKEKGAILTALQSKEHKRDMTFSMVALRAAKVLNHPYNEITLQGTLGWRHAYGKLNPEARLSSLISTKSFNVLGAPIARDSALVNMAINVQLNKQANIKLSYIGQAAKGVQDNSVAASVAYNF